MLQANLKDHNVKNLLNSIWKRDEPAVVRYEQAVYGSFPFWDRGYAVLAQSPGCRTEWLADLKTACQRFGEPPLGTSAAGAMFALRLPSGPWAIVGVGSPGLDDQGRPGALSFHALLVAPREFRKARFDPFALADALRRDWGPDTKGLESGSWPVERTPEPASTDDPELRWTVARLMEGRRVARESADPIDGLARGVWLALPEHVRRRAAVATLAFTTANRFDLVSLPRLASVAPDESYLAYTGCEALSDPVPARRQLGNDRRLWGVTLAVACLVVVGVIAVMSQMRRGRESHVQARTNLSSLSGLSLTRAPDRQAYRDERLSPDEQASVTEGLLDLAQRFGVVEASSASHEDPTALMIALADRLRYRGPYLDEAELTRLMRERDPERAEALAWHRQVLRFAADRPLPADFARGPLRWQLDTLAWSFHVEPNPRWSVAEVPHALADVLAVERPIHSSSLITRYPPLDAYARFLSRLPRR
ncbi:MAG TPA: hypothetical protein VGZ22_14885 [Isosphaeraceae bacterium]|jgi:hypothetical protein|nr:hypothetical protein [Isosphaeraceae bacterium]